MNLSDIKKHMVDLRRSSFDKERSTPKDGKYYWTNKVYLQSKDYRDNQTRPKFAYRWVAFDESNDFVNFNHWKMKYGAVAVDYKDPINEVYPEPLTPSVEGNYRYMDMILMRIPLEVFIEEKISNIKQYEHAREGLDRKFRSEAATEGAEVESVRL